MTFQSSDNCLKGAPQPLDPQAAERETRVTRVTLWGSVVNLVLTALKILAGVFGHSAAMIADGVHSLSDLMSDWGDDCRCCGEDGGAVPSRTS